MQLCGQPRRSAKSAPSLSESSETSMTRLYKQALLEITSRHPNYVQIFTDGSKVDEKVAAAAVSSVAPNSPFSCQLRDHCSIYTAELQAILFALKQAYQSQERKFMIFSDSLSALQGLGKLKTDHPLLIQIQELLHKINTDQKKLFLCGFLEMLVFEETRLLIELLKKLLIKKIKKNPTADLMPFSDLKPLTAKYVYQVWQKEWDETVLISNKFHEILPKLPDKFIFLLYKERKHCFK